MKALARFSKAEDGVAALSVFEEHLAAIDLVVLDLRMPRLSGRDTLRGIRRMRPDVRVVVSSGHAGDHEVILESEAVAGELRKPYDQDQLTATVRAVLDGARLDRERT